MTKPFTFRSREGCLSIGRYLKSFTGVLAIHRSDTQLGIFFRSDRKVSYESYSQISLLSLFTSLRRTAGLWKRIYFSRIGLHKSHWRATKENSVIKEKLIFESRTSFCFCDPRKNQASHQAGVGRWQSVLITKDMAYLTIHNACSMQITVQIIQKVSRLSKPLKEEISCNQARQQKCNYRTKQLIHAQGFWKPRARLNCNANWVN